MTESATGRTPSVRIAPPSIRSTATHTGISSATTVRASRQHVKSSLRPGLYGRPLEEVDPFVFEDTFCVVAKKYGSHYVYRFSASKSLFIFGPLNPIRKVACRIITNQLFDLLIILVIVCNCVTLGLSTNYEVGTTGKMLQNYERQKIVDIMEMVFLTVYTAEMVLKTISKGFVVNKFSYLRNGWNVLDCTVVILSYSTIVIEVIIGNEEKSGVDLDFLRTLRVLRAIKTISILPGLKMMINALFNSAVQLVEVMALTLFCLMIFALLALQLFMGRLRHKCVLVKGGSRHLKMIQDQGRDRTEMYAINPGTPDQDRLWFNWIHREQNWLKRIDGYPKDEFMPCSNSSGGRPCPAGYVCLDDIGENFDDGWTSFDTFHSSMLSTLQLITLDFWERLYDLVLSSTNPWAIIFFLIVIFLGAFYLLNLMLAVVAMSYEEEVHKATETPLTKHQKLSLYRTASTFSFEDPNRLNVSLMTHYKKRTPSERGMIARTLGNTGADKPPPRDPDENKGSGLHFAIMQLLGRRLSMEGKDEKVLEKEDSVTPTESEWVPKANANVSPPPSAPRSIMAQPSYSKSDQSLKQSEYSNLSRSRSVLMKARATMAAPMKAANRFLLPIKRVLSPVVNHWTFEIGITIMIVINTVLLASEHHRQPQWLEQLLETSNYFFLAVFLFEAIIKICALQVDYFRSWWNIFDLFIVVVSMVDLFLTAYNFKLTVVRSMRLLRVFKLAQSWITMKVLLNIIFSTFGALGNLVLVLLIVLYIFAVLGLEVVGSNYTRKAFDAVDNEDDFPRWNWQDFGYAFMMVFRILCGEWIEPLWDCLKATAERNEQYRCFVIYLPILIIGNFIVLNLFLALLLNSFDTEELTAQRERELQASGKTDNLKKVITLMLTQKGSTRTLIHEANDDGASSVSSEDPAADASGDGMKTRSRLSNSSSQPLRGKALFKQASKRIIVQRRKDIAIKMIEKASLKMKQTKASSRTMNKTNSLAKKTSSYGLGRQSLSQAQIAERMRYPDSCTPAKCWNYNCCLCNSMRSSSWTSWDDARTYALRVVSHPLFEWFILALIFASSITLCFEDVELEQRPKLKAALRWLGLIFTIIFIIEMLLKWFALGFWNYFTNSWTILDFIIVMISVISIQSEFIGSPSDRGQNQLGAFKSLRTLRALRPLRAISRWQGMKIVVNALMYAIPSIVNVLLVCLLFWLIFSIMGVQFFKGKFYKCVDNDSGQTLSHEIVQNKAECCANTDKWSWVNTQPNFDNVFQGYLTLLQVATFEGWMEAMRAGVDSTEINKQPIRDHSFVYYVFFVIFIMFGSFFTLNLFIGVIIDNFNRLKKKYEGNLLEALLTPSQRHYYTAMKKLGRKKPRKVIKRPENSFMSLFYDISMSRRFEIAIFLMIFFNMIIMAFEYDEQRDVYLHVLAGFNSFFTTIYTLEALVKIIGLRQFYFTVPWNLFDFVLVVASIVDLALGDLATVELPFPPTMLRIIRVFRIGRVLRLIKAAKGIRKLLFALIVSLPALFNIGALLALITFIYAILGMSLFGRIAKNTAIDEMFNFGTFMRSSLMLFRIMTAAGWNDVLSAMTVETPECGTYRKIKCGGSKEEDCANEAAAIAFLVSYLIITYLIVINMYIAVILENFVEANQEEEVGIVDDDLEMFYLRWARYDPQATQFISFDQLSEFLASLDPPLSIPKPNIVAIVAFNLPIARGNKIHCLDIIHALVKHVLGHIDDSEDFRKVQEEMEQKFRKQFPSRKLLDIISSTRVWKIQHNAAIVIQRAWRAYRARKAPAAVEKVRSGMTITGQDSGTVPPAHLQQHKMLNKMGNLLHLGHNPKGKRRLSLAAAGDEKRN